MEGGAKFGENPVNVGFCRCGEDCAEKFPNAGFGMGGHLR
jgi:hypothetical protein